MGNPGKLLVLALTLATPTVAAAQSAQNANPSLSVSASATEDVVKAGSEVKVKVVLKNISNQKLVVPKEGTNKPERDYTIRVTDDGGNVPPLTKYGRAVIKNDGVLVGRLSSVTLEPGGTLNEDVAVTSLFDLSKPGKYNVQLEGFDGSTKSKVKSNTITVTVIP